MRVTLVVDVENLKEKSLFEKHLKKEGFSEIENEDFVYIGEASSHIFNTRAYTLETITKGLSTTSFDSCKIIFQIGDNLMETYQFNKNSREFIEIKQ